MQVGLLPPSDAALQDWLLQGTASAPALWSQAAKSLQHFMEQQRCNHCLGKLGVPGRVTLPTTLHCLSHWEHPQKNRA